MAKFCGGIKLGDSFKVIKGVICDANAESVDISKAITVCGQLWDGATFALNGKVVSLVDTGDTEDALTVIKSNCGCALDGRFFKVAKGVVTYENPVTPDPEPEEPRGDN